MMSQQKLTSFLHCAQRSSDNRAQLILLVILKTEQQKIGQIFMTTEACLTQISSVILLEYKNRFEWELDSLFLS